MATAYAAVVSLMHVIDQVHLYHSRQLIFVDEQLIQLQSLNQLLIFLQDFLERYSHGRSSKEMEALECRIAKAAHVAEDIIESCIVDDVHARSNGDEKRSPDHFSQALWYVIEGMDLIKKDVMETKEKRVLTDQLPRDPAPIPSSRPPSRKETVVVHDEDLNHILNNLVDQQSSRQVIPITGMGGIGKTTLAKIAYENLLVVSHFDIHGWVTISQQYDVQEILLRLFKSMHVDIRQSGQEIYELGMKLYQYLFARRYLIVLDDMWSIEAWDELKSFLPDNNNGSRVMVTSRMLNVVDNFPSSNLYQMSLLDDNKSWSLLCKKVFVEENCHPELVDVGKTIAKNCKGLPLSIDAVGGLLAKSNMVRQYWEYVAENINMSVSSDDEENCLNILSLSYIHLPIHLKPCFLYLGVFREDYEISVSRLIKFWVAEGFLKPDRAKSLEEVGRDYLKDLTERSLLSVTTLGLKGNAKSCQIHDLLRHMCLIEAQKENFLRIKAAYMPNNSQGINRHFNIFGSVNNKPIVEFHNKNILKGENSQRRVAMHLMSNERYTPQDIFVNQPNSFLRSLICDFQFDCKVLVNFRLLRIFDMGNCGFSEVIFQLINLRYLNLRLTSNKLPSSIDMLWNLHTLRLAVDRSTSSSNIVAPVEIWKMPQLKRVKVTDLCLPDPPPDSQMDNLHQLSFLLDFTFTEEVVRKIPNVVKLKLRYGDNCDKGLPPYSLNNVRHLKKLQSLLCQFPHKQHNYLRDVQGFPGLLKKLLLVNVRCSWEDITTKIGPLPYLEMLHFISFSSEEDEWNPVEGHFLNLKYLGLMFNFELLRWTADSVHFPVLEHLFVVYIKNLKEIPSGIGDIATLRLIQLRDCTDSIIDSAKEILKEQLSLGNESIRLLVDDKRVIINSHNDHFE